MGLLGIAVYQGMTSNAHGLLEGPGISFIIYLSLVVTVMELIVCAYYTMKVAPSGDVGLVLVLDRYGRGLASPFLS